MDVNMEVSIEEWMAVPKDKRMKIIALMKHNGLETEEFVKFDKLVDEEIEEQRFEDYYGEE